MGKLIKCTRCKAELNCTAKYMRKRAEAFDGDVKKLRKKYVCRVCRKEEDKDQKQFSISTAINELESFQNLSSKVKIETTCFLSTNISNPQNQKQYKVKLKQIFDEHSIVKYTINIEQNTIKSVSFNIPIIGTMEIKI